MRGSVVMMPLTSVHISMAPARSPPPTSAAVKSLPPRPSVVVIPSVVAPMKPPITGVFPASTNGSTSSVSLASIAASSGAALP